MELLCTDSKNKCVVINSSLVILPLTLFLCFIHIQMNNAVVTSEEKYTECAERLVVHNM